MTTRPKFPTIEPMTQDIADGLTSADNPSSTNPFATQNDAAIAFSVTAAPGSSQAIPVGTGEASITQVDFSVARFNPGTVFSLGTDTFTAPVDGKYLFTGRVTYASVPDGFTVSIALAKNFDPTVGLQGTEQWYGGSNGEGATGAPLISATVTALLDLTAGDTVGLYTQHTAAVPLALQVEGVGADFEGSGVRFEGFRVGA